MVFRLLVVLALAAAQPAIAADEKLTLRLGQRSVDLGPYFFGYPYFIDHVSFRSGKVFYSVERPGEPRRLYRTDWDGTGPLVLPGSDARPVSDLDLNAINFWGAQFSRHLDRLIVMGSLDKSERINLWLYPDGPGTPQALTDVDYIYSWTSSPDETRIYFKSRYGDSDHARGCVEVLDLTGPGAPRQRTLVCDDAPGFPGKLSDWSAVRVDGDRLWFLVNTGRRDDHRLVRHDMTTGVTEAVLDFPDTPFLWLLQRTGGAGQVIYVRSDEIALYDETTGQARTLARFANSIYGTDTITDPPDEMIAVVVDGLAEKEVVYYRFDGTALEELSRERHEATVSLAADRNPRFLQTTSSIDLWWKVETREIGPDGARTLFPFIEGLDQLSESLRHCRSEKVGFRHRDAVTGEDIAVEGYLLQPAEPVPEDRRLYVIDAFYGGGNWFSVEDQLLCAVGVTVLTPTVRGDDRLDPAFEQANDGANADAPVRDVIAAARYLADRFALDTPRRIGLKGFSHGGWAAMRALTWPEADGFDFGFALAGAGPYDLPAAVDTADGARTNILGWVVKEFGDPATDAVRLAYLSPASHIDRLGAPVFLYHGADDERIAATVTTDFALRLAEAGKSVTVMILPEQGHGITGPEDQHRLYQAMFDFLDGVLADLDR